jgi:hypothetical protein
VERLLRKQGCRQNTSNLNFMHLKREPCCRLQEGPRFYT